MNRVSWIDIFKGIGITTVCMGHIFEGNISSIIYIFHMPLFFFISGYLSKPTVNYKEYLIKKIKSLIIPYFVFLFILYLLFYDLPDFQLYSLFNYFKKPFIGGRMLNGSFSVFWFITCLFITQQLMNFILSRFSFKFSLFLVLLFLLLSYINSLYFTDLWLPWNANVVFAAAPIYFVGYWFKDVTMKQTKLKTFTLFVLGFLIVFFSPKFSYNVYDMKSSFYGYPIITFVSSIIMILIVVKISKYLSNFETSKKLFANLGKASLVIMYLHQPIQIMFSKHVSESFMLRLSVSLLISQLIYLLFKRYQFTRRFLLGEL